MTYEHLLSSKLRKLGSFVAIGDPTERLPALGAARVYTGDDQWRRAFDSLIARGGLIILHLDDSPGVAWELEHIIGVGDPERLILSLPLPPQWGKRLTSETTYDDVRIRFGQLFPKGLPKNVAHTRFLYFDTDWTPHRIELLDRSSALPAAGSLAEQRARVLRRLAAVFKPLWAPRWVRILVYLLAFVVLLALVVVL